MGGSSVNPDLVRRAAEVLHEARSIPGTGLLATDAALAEAIFSDPLCRELLDAQASVIECSIELAGRGQMGLRDTIERASWQSALGRWLAAREALAKGQPE